MISRGTFAEGKPRMFMAVIGRPPMAQMSDRQLAAMILPHATGSLTTGAKKSTVCTSAVSSSRRNTPASSIVSMPTMRSGLSILGRPARSPDSLSGGILPAQPAQGVKSSRFTA